LAEPVAGGTSGPGRTEPVAEPLAGGRCGSMPGEAAAELTG